MKLELGREIHLEGGRLGDTFMRVFVNRIGDSVWAKIGDILGSPPWASVWGNLRASVWGSLRTSVWVSRNEEMNE